MAVTIEKMVARWTDPAARPLFRGGLIDDNGCCCAQGDVLRQCGWSDDQLRSTEQMEADRAVARELGISLTHSVLLRQVNDSADGCPQDVLAHPERILSDQARRVLAFWSRLDTFTPKQWFAARKAENAAEFASNAAKAAARVASDAAKATASDDARYAAWVAARDAAREAEIAATHAARDAAGYAAGWATNEIQGSSRLETYRFLPIFGITHPSELTRMNRDRRKQIEKAEALISEATDIIDKVRSDEQDASDNLPDSLRRSAGGSRMIEAVDALEQALDNLEDTEVYLSSAREPGARPKLYFSPRFVRSAEFREGISVKRFDHG